jgi:hypothetical protein
MIIIRKYVMSKNKQNQKEVIPNCALCIWEKEKTCRALGNDHTVSCYNTKMCRKLYIEKELK